MKKYFFITALYLYAASLFGQLIDYQNFEKNASKETVFQVGHTAEISVSVVSSDGALAFTADRDGSIKIWKLPELHLIRTITTSGLPITSMTVTPDGRYIAIANLEKSITLINTQSGEVYKTLSGHTASVAAVQCNKEGTFLASISVDRSVRVWHIPSGITYMHLKDLKSVGTTVAFSDDGKQVAAGFSNGEISLYDMKAKKEIRTIKAHNERITALAFSSDGSFLVSSDKNGVIVKTILVSATSRQITRIASLVTAIALQGDDFCFITAEDGMLYRLNIATGEMLLSLHAHTRSATTLSFFQQSSLLLTCGDDKVVRLWKFGGEDLVAVHTPHDDWITTAAFSKDGTMLATGSKDKTIRIWRYPSMEIVGTFIGHGDEITSIVFSPNGKYFASTSKDASVRVWDIVEKMTISIFQGHKGWVLNCAFSPEGNLIASGGEDGAVMLWEMGSTTTKKIFRHHKGWVTSVAFSPDGKMLYSAGHDKTVKFISLATGSVQTTLSGPSGSIEQMVLSKDGLLLAAAEQFNKAYLWSVNDGKLLSSFHAHAGALTSLGISNNGKLLVTGGSDKIVKLWTIEGKLLKTFTDHSREITHVLFSADDTSIVSVARDKSLRIRSSTECVPLVSEGSTFTPLYMATNGQEKHAFIVGDRILVLPDKKYISIESGSTVLAISETILAAATQKSIVLYSIMSGDIITEYSLKNGIQSLYFSDDGNFLYFNDKAGAIFSYELLSKKDMLFSAAPKNIQKIAPLKNGLLVLSIDGICSSIMKNRSTSVLNLTGVKVIDMTVDNESSVVYTLNDNRTISLWKIDGTLVKTIKVSVRIPTHIALMSGGKTIAVLGKEPGIKIIRAVDGVAVTTLAEKMTFTAFQIGKDYLSARMADNSIVVMRQSGKDMLRLFMFKNHHVFEYNGSYEYSKDLVPYVRTVQGYSIVPRGSFSTTPTVDVLSMFFK